MAIRSVTGLSTVLGLTVLLASQGNLSGAVSTGASLGPVIGLGVACLVLTAVW